MKVLPNHGKNLTALFAALAATAIATASVAAMNATPKVSAGPGTRAATAVPNIVVVMTDDQTVEQLRVMPNVRRLIGDAGVVFETNFASYPLCCPSRATFLTGQYAHNHGVLSNRMPTGGYPKLDHAKTLPVWLRASGYRTIHLGKYLNGYGGQSATQVPPGWAEWYGSVDPTTYDYVGFTLNENGKHVKYGNAPAAYQTDVYTRKASEIIRRVSSEPAPFFLSVAFLAPHWGRPRDPDDSRGGYTPAPAARHRDKFAKEPLPRPPSFDEADVADKPLTVRQRPRFTAVQVRAMTENYQQELESLLSVDEGVAQIVAALDQAGVLDRTVILFTSDNGFLHGEHRIREGKNRLYEPSIRVPLLVRGPGFRPGTRVRELTANIDLAPTILDLANAVATRELDGRSLVPLLTDPTRRMARQIVIERPADGPTNELFSALRTNRYVYAEYTNGDRELYDLRRDPHQLNSVHAASPYAAIGADLARRLAVLRRCIGAACRRLPSLALRTTPTARCVGSRLTLSVGGSETASIGYVDFLINGRRVARDRRAPYRVVLPARRLPRPSARIRARFVLSLGDVLTLDRRVRRCS
ncbi:MAG: sulfatase [Gaiellaceae bacterium]